MKKFAWIGLLVVVGLLLAKGVGRAEDVKIGAVNINKIYSGYTKIAEDKAEFKKLQEERQADVQKKVEAADKEIKALQDKLDNQGKAMKKEVSDKIAADIGKKKQDILNLQQEFDQEIQTKRSDMIEAWAEKTAAAIAKLAKEKGYTVVIDMEAVFYFPDAADLSDQIVAVLNKPVAVFKAPTKGYGDDIDTIVDYIKEKVTPIIKEKFEQRTPREGGAIRG